jgi:two-component system, NarL family, sensor histidine kinase UhpB
MNSCRLILLLFLMPFLAVKGQGWRIDSLQQIVQENKQDVGELKALNLLATEYTRTDMPKAKTYLHRSIVLAKTLNNARNLGYAYSQMVSVQMNDGHPDSAKIYLNLLEKLAADPAQPMAKGNYYFAAGLFYRMQSRFKEALPYMFEALDEDIANDKKNSSNTNREAIAGQSLNIGNNYMDMGAYRNALQYHLKALQLFEGTGNKKGESFCYQAESSDFIRLDQYKPALSYAQKAMVLMKELKDKRGVGTVLGQIGTIYQGLIQYDSALVYSIDALDVFREMKLVVDEAKANLNIGKIYKLKNDPADASSYFRQSKLLAGQIGDSSLSAQADEELITLQTHINQQQEAEKKLMSGLATSIELGDKNMELVSYRYISDHYAGTRQFDKALAYSNKFHEVKDSVESKDIQLQMKKLEEQYNLGKKETEIALLKKDQLLNQVELQKQETFRIGAILFLALSLLIGFLLINRYRIVNKARRLIDMERMRNNIARDLHDDIGSTLTSINILSKMALQQAHGHENMSVNLQKIKDRSAGIMESMGDIVWAINPQNDSLDKMIFRMKEFMAEILEPLNINYSFKEEGDLSAIKLDIKKRKDFYLLFKEAVNNAAKYSHCRNLEIHVQQDQHFLHLKVVDDGKGFNQQLVKSGNGLANMRERAASMEGTVQVDSSIGRGTGIRLEVPIT